MSKSEHATRVAGWLARSVADGHSAPQLARSFERAVAALWARAHRTLGDVTLTAILGRVLHDASERFPAFPPLTVGENGIDAKELHARAHALSVPEASAATSFVLTEFLTVLGNLTAEILTPALHAELSNIGPPGEPDEESADKRAHRPRTIGRESTHDQED